MNRPTLVLAGAVAGSLLTFLVVSQTGSWSPPETPPPVAPAPPEAPGPSPALASTDEGPDQRAATASEIEEGVVTFMAYNLKNYLRMDRQVDGRSRKDAPKPEDEVRALVAMIEDVKPDLLGVCEIGTDADLADLQARLKAAGVDLPHRDYMDSADPYRNLGLLSRFPVVARNHQASLTYQLDDTLFPFHRGIYDATVEPTPGYRLRLVGTHLKSKRPVNEGEQKEMRRQEAHLLRKHCDAILKEQPEANLLVFGDLNDTRNTPAIAAIKGDRKSPLYLQDLVLRDRWGFTWTHYWFYADQYARFDYALVSRGLKPEILENDSYIHHAPEWWKASDHRPVVVRLMPEK